ncbi:AAA family ATPase [uncultured Cohaesibacter sp.]|uniref:AAA family ATPase n=1 Tax=uncultured Cohaesibacter sp. TaxID=1002546 RepID=UPI00292D390C|nr:AAA family ATPase [uncultured Cohaesibacter sp.]
MTRLLVINGPAAVGKTTLCATLAKHQPGCINISGDALRWFAPPDVKNHLGPGSTYKASAALINAYTEMGASLILFDYIFPTPQSFTGFVNMLSPEVTFHLFTLWAPLETVRAREAGRKERERLGEQVIQTHQTLENNLDFFRQHGQILDNDAANPDHCIRLITQSL